MTTLIEQLAAAKGIASEYVDAWGQPAQVSEESKAAMLGAMGYRVDDEAALTSSWSRSTACTGCARWTP